MSRGQSIFAVLEALRKRIAAERDAFPDQIKAHLLNVEGAIERLGQELSNYERNQTEWGLPDLKRITNP